MSELEFSVAMCVYGGDDPEWFKAAVDSVTNQTRKPDEIVLVVDGPVPETLDKIICELESNMIFKVVRLEKNVGHGNARRTCIDACSYSIIALMDADDISAPDRFEKQLAFFENNAELSVVGSNITEFIGEPENIVARREVPSTDVEIREYIKRRCPMNHMTVMYRKEDIMKAGGYIDWYCNEDYYLWLRMYLAGLKFANSKDVFVNVRVGKEMYGRRGGVKYFKSEAKLQKYMLDNGIIGFGTYTLNVAKRLIVQVLLPNRLRGWVFRKFARKKV